MRLDRLLVLSFVLTVASFLISRWIWETRTQGIDVAANSITSDAAQAVEHLSKARAELRRMQGALGDLAETAAEHDDANRKESASQLESAFRRAGGDFEHDWSAYVALPPYPGEEDLWTTILGKKRAMDDSIGRVLGASAAGDGRGASREFNERAEPLFEGIDAGLQRAVDINARSSARLAGRISELRSRELTLGRILDALSALLAVSAALLVIHFARRFARMTEQRVSELEHFAGRVAHDIRSPLMSVGLALELAKRATESDARARSALDRASRTLQRMGQLVDGLLVFARAGAAPEHGEMADVQVALGGVVEEMLPVAQDKAIDLQVQESQPAVAACSPGVLSSLISNLVGNALKYMGDAPVKIVNVRVRDVGSAVRVEVQDTGPGVPQELRARIFDPYVRGAESTVPGLGLGLATVRRLAEAHGGAVGLGEVDSGSLFWFEIPRVPGRLKSHLADADTHGRSDMFFEAQPFPCKSRR